MKLALCWRIVNGSLTRNIDPRAFSKVGLAIYQSWETFFKCGQLARYTTAVPKCAFRDGRAELAQCKAVTWHNCNRSVDHSARNWLLVFRVMQLWIQGGGAQLQWLLVPTLFSLIRATDVAHCSGIGENREQMNEYDIATKKLLLTWCYEHAGFTLKSSRLQHGANYSSEYPVFLQLPRYQVNIKMP